MSLILDGTAGVTATGVAAVGDGTVSLPGVAVGELDCGVYHIGTNNLGVAVNGAKVLDIATTGLTVTGSVLSTSSVTAAAFNTSNGITGNIVSGVATTIADVAARGRYDFYAALNNAGSTNYTAFATVVSEGTNYRIVANNGANLTLTLSGSSVQVTQTSGGVQAINYAYTKIA